MNGIKYVLLLVSLLLPVHRVEARSEVHPSGPPYSLHVLKLRDDGSLESTRELKSLADSIARKPQTVVVFMHGWKGTANDNDPNVNHFLIDLAAARKRSYEASKRTLTGVYITWDARVLPGMFEYLSYFCTRSRANRVAIGTGIPLIVHTLAEAAKDRGREHFIVTGHSFGARILGRAVGKHPEMLREADVFMLANSADDASKGREIIRAVNANPYPLPHGPKLVWITSAHDDVTRYLYKLAGGKIAIGHDRKLQTHLAEFIQSTRNGPAKAYVTRTSHDLGGYAHNIYVVKGLGEHHDVWGPPMIYALNRYLGLKQNGVIIVAAPH